MEENASWMKSVLYVSKLGVRGGHMSLMFINLPPMTFSIKEGLLFWVVAQTSNLYVI